MAYKDPEKRRAYQREWCRRNRGKNSSAVRRWQENMREALTLHKKWQGCLICQIKDPVVLEYHHISRDTKSFNVAAWRSKNSTQAIQIEIDKCVVLCANCHRRVEAGSVTLPVAGWSRG